MLATVRLSRSLRVRVRVSLGTQNAEVANRELADLFALEANNLEGSSPSLGTIWMAKQLHWSGD